MRENMELLIKKLNKACLIYKKDFLNKDFLVIARKRKNTEIIEVNFRKEHFMHLVGIKGMKERQHETELLAGPERGLLLNLAQ